MVKMFQTTTKESADTTENADEKKKPILDPEFIQSQFSFWNMDAHAVVEQIECDFEQIRQQREKSYNYEMRSELKRVKTFSTFEPHSFYTPEEMADAGFYFTGLDNSYQCFCCGVILFTTSCTIPPFAKHQEAQPDCPFVQGKDSGNILKYDVRVQLPETTVCEHLSKYKLEEVRLESFQKWPFYAKTDPGLLAAAGFFFTGNKDKVQCFCCNGSLANWEADDDPWKEHAKWFSECKYLQSQKSQEEIKQYIETYKGYTGVTGEHYISGFIMEQDIKKALSAFSDAENEKSSQSLYEDEKIRLESFKTWPKDAKAEPSALAATGFYYKGISDQVQCIGCAGILVQWEVNDDPWEEHLKHFPNCRYSSARRSEEKCCERPHSNVLSPKEQENNQEKNSTNMEAEFPSFTDAAKLLCDTDLSKINNMNLYLRKVYSSTAYRKVLPFGETTSVSTDLKYVYSELTFISKDERNQTLANVTLPEIIRHLSNITIIEGEAGSGKSALLKKIAILWASGCCPVLQRFKLVFYVPLSSLDDVQGLAYTIHKQLLGAPNFILTDAMLKSMLDDLKDQALFLIDDWGENNSVPNCIKAMTEKKHTNKNCIMIASRTNTVGSVRKFASSIFAIREFPLYNTVCILKKLFSHDIQCVQNFFCEVVISKTLQSIMKSPLFAVVISVSWVHFPQKKAFSITNLFKAYLHYNTLKFSSEETLSTVIASCQQLALEGYLKSQFEFTDKDLSEAGVDGAEAVRLRLISKFTSQRLHPVYRFLHPCFQEYLAGKKLSDYLASDSQEANEKGLRVLQNINTFLKFSGQYFYFLQCACDSSKSVCKIITCLCNMMKSSNALDAQSENQVYLKHHPELATTQNVFTVTLAASENTECRFAIINHYFLEFVIQAAYKNVCIAQCCSQIQHFLKGTNLYFGKSPQPHTMLIKFLCDYPESFTLLSSVTFTIMNDKVQPKLDFSPMNTTFFKTGVPSTESDYADAYQLLDTKTQNYESGSKSQCRILRLIPRYLPDMFIAPFISAQAHKIPLLKLQVHGTDRFEDSDLTNLMELFAASCHIELHLKESKGFMEIIKPAIEHSKGLFTKCEIFRSSINSKEEKLLLSMSNLESLDITIFQEEEIPENIFSNINQLPCLKELSVMLYGKERRLVDKITDEFGSLRMMEKLVFKNVDMRDDSQKLAGIVQCFPKLVIFHLKCTTFPAFMDLLMALICCKTLQEIVFEMSSLSDDDILAFASVLSRFSALKIMDVHHMNFRNKKASEDFVNALQSLNQLEVIHLPMGSGITAVASAIVHQFQHLPHLRHLSFDHCLTDDSLMQLAKVAQDGFLCKLEMLMLNTNHELTDSGWKDFFLTANNMPKLKEFHAHRMYDHSLKPNPQTVRAFVQFVSRLPNLVTIAMYGWLLDTQDLNMFKEMKEQHPKSKRLTLFWQWWLPFQANVTE